MLKEGKIWGDHDKTSIKTVKQMAREEFQRMVDNRVSVQEMINGLGNGSGKVELQSRLDQAFCKLKKIYGDFIREVKVI